MKRIILLTIIFSSLFLTGCNDQRKPVFDVSLGDRHLAVNAKFFNASVKRGFRKYCGTDISICKSKDALFEYRKKQAKGFIDALTTRLIIDNYDYNPSEEEIQKQLEFTYKRYSSKEAYYEEMKKQGITDETIKSIAINTLKHKHLVKTTGVFKPTKKEIEDYYKKHTGQFTIEQKYYINDILIKTNFSTIKREIIEKDKKNKLSAAEVDNTARKTLIKNQQLINELEQKLKAHPKNFANYAKIYSQDKELAPSGGEIEFSYYLDGYSYEYNKAAKDLKVGEITGPVTSRFGKHFIYKRNYKPKRIKPINEVEDYIINMLYYDNEQEYVKAAVEKLKYNVRVTYFDPTLRPNAVRKKNIFEKIFSRK